MHRHKPVRLQVPENSDGFIRSHMNLAKRFRMICANRQQRDLWSANLSNFLKTIKIRAVTGMIYSTSLVLEDKTSITSMVVPERACSPMFAWRQCYLPVPVAEALPPFQFNHPLETQVVGKISNTPWH